METSCIGPPPPLIAPLRFSIVSHSVNFTSQDQKLSIQSIYKGGFPRKRNIPFLKRLRLKTILSLTPKSIEGLDRDVCDWAHSANVTLVHIKCEKPKDDGGGLSKETAARALMHMLDTRQLPLYVHCLDGQSVSTLLIGVLRKVQAWSSKATIEEITRSLGHNDEVIDYQRSFIDKFGRNDGIRLPPRRFLPDWTWSEPNPLSRLKDPYDVIIPRERLPQDRTSSQNGSITPTNSHPLSNKKKFENNEGFFSAVGSGVVTSNNSPSAMNYGIGNLPVQHPLIKLRFDHDAELPPPPVLYPPSTPVHARDGGNNYMSPSPSRPSSRTGRHNNHNSILYAHGHHSDILSSSRPGSSQASPLISVQNVHPSPNKEWSPSLDYAINKSDQSTSRQIFASSDSGISNSSNSSSSSSLDDMNQIREHPRVSALHHHMQHHESSTPTRPSNLSNTSTPRASISKPKNATASTNEHHQHRSEELYGLGLHNDVNEASRILLPSTDHSGAGNDAVCLLSRENTFDSELGPKRRLSMSERKDHSSGKEVDQTKGIASRDESRRFQESILSSDLDTDNGTRTAALGYQGQTGGADDVKDDAFVRTEDYADDVRGVGSENYEESEEEEEEDEEEGEGEEEDEDDDDDEGEDDNDGLALEALDLEGF